LNNYPAFVIYCNILQPEVFVTCRMHQICVGL